MFIDVIYVVVGGDGKIVKQKGERWTYGMVGSPIAYAEPTITSQSLSMRQGTDARPSLFPSNVDQPILGDPSPVRIWTSDVNHVTI